MTVVAADGAVIVPVIGIVALVLGVGIRIDLRRQVTRRDRRRWFVDCARVAPVSGPRAPQDSLPQSGCP